MKTIWELECFMKRNNAYLTISIDKKKQFCVLAMRDGSGLGSGIGKELTSAMEDLMLDVRNKEAAAQAAVKK